MAISSEIITACKKGKRKAIKAFYESCSGWMLGISQRYISDRNEAMSIVNLAVLKALENLEGFDESRAEHIESWLKKILIRKAIDYIRKEKKANEEIQESMQEVRNMGESNRREEELLGMVNSLPTKTRAVFNLFAIEGYKHQEIAEMLEISIGTSKWHLNEARNRLRGKLEELDKIMLAK